MIDVALNDALISDGGVAAIVATRAYPQRAPANATYPLITYQAIAAGVEQTRKLAGAVDHLRPLVQVDVYAATRLEAIALANAVRAALDGKVNQSWGGFDIKASIFDQQLDAPFDPAANLHRITQQYRIAFGE